METRRIGSLEVSIVGLGCNNFVEKLLDFAASRQHSLLDLAFSWLLSHPPVASVIAGATSPEQVRANVAAAGWQLSPADLAEIDQLAPAA